MGTLTLATQVATDLRHGADRTRFVGWQGAAIVSRWDRFAVTGDPAIHIAATPC